MESVTMDESQITESDEESDFEDAEENIPPSNSSSMDFGSSIEEMRVAVHLFFNNNFTEAKKMMEPWAKTSMYHALGSAVFEFLEAVLTFEPDQIRKASNALQHSVVVCKKIRHKTGIAKTIGNMVSRTNYDVYTMEEIHAELCYAEALLIKSILSFVEDETLTSFIKAGMKIKSCFSIYKGCNVILKTRKWSDDKMKAHFESGVRMGIGTFNLMISLLPSRVIKLLEFIGFSGNKEVGLAELEKGFALKQGLRQVLSVMTLLGYNLIVIYVISHQEGNLALCEKILKEQLLLYPNGVWFLFFKGRLELMQGNLVEAQKWYEKSWKSQDIWPQFHHLCFWELMWTHSLSLEWSLAVDYADRLRRESRWSRTIYNYQKGSLMLMLGTELTPDQKIELEQLMRTVPNYKQRIAGKSLPMEKFVIRRSDRYFAQKRWLCLPGIELMYLWNFFKILSKNKTHLRRVMKLIDDALQTLPNHPEYAQDNKSLLFLLKGCALRMLTMYLQSEECFQYVIDNAKKLKEDNFLVPYAVFEMSLVHLEQENYSKALAYLEDAKKNYTGYSLESRLHFKIHSASNHLAEMCQSSSQTRLNS